jgi:hypothetical protein
VAIGVREARTGRGSHGGSRDYCIDPTSDELARVATEQWNRNYARFVVPVSAIVGGTGLIGAIAIAVAKAVNP